EQIVFFLDDRVEFVPQTEVQSQSRSNPKIILDKTGVPPIVDVPRWIANQESSVARDAGEEILNTLGKEVIGSASPKLNPSSRTTVTRSVESIVMEFRTKLDYVLAHGVGHVVHELITHIGTLDFRPVKPAQFLRENVKGEYANPRQSTIQRIGNSRIQPIHA